MNALSKEATIPVYVFSSPAYYPDPGQRQVLFEELTAALKIGSGALRFHLIDSESVLLSSLQAIDSELAFFIPTSGAVQPWMLRAADLYRHIALINAYLPDFIATDITEELLHKNAHPACTDFYAHRRLEGKSIYWISSPDELPPIYRSYQSVKRLRSTRLIQIGETEPWVINSCRDIDLAKQRFGIDIVKLGLEDLYSRFNKVSPEEVVEVTNAWTGVSAGLQYVSKKDVSRATTVFAAMSSLLREHEADGIAMACFAMIKDLDTTSCLALSMLNEAAQTIGACEGDLDAAITMFLLKSMGADFVWIGNPIIYTDPYIDLVHCTAPRYVHGKALNYRLMRHHESGRGVSPEVVLPSGETVTLVRIGNNLNDIVCHTGRTEFRPKLHTCNTQIRVHLDSKKVRESLLGTHLVLTFGNYEEEILYASDFLDLHLNPSVIS